MTSKRAAKAPFAGKMYLQGVYAVAERIPGEARFPFNLPFVRGLDVGLDQPVTFFVGENGSGKSTLLEAIADLCGLHVAGGGSVDTLYTSHEQGSELARVLRPRFRHRPRDGFFFRAETLVNFATLLEERQRDPDFMGDPYMHYGGKSLHLRSHGEAFLDVFQHRIHDGLFLIDEPEAALSPQRQLTLLYLLRDRVERGRAQFIIATHAPILLTFPGAVIHDFDDPALPEIALQDTKHYQITRGILEHPERYWRSDGSDDPAG
ncbi:AAA family ATPase [Polyangium mundeleinium]|uniref:AAA family ATPase n=1 Tax=Polyangium mundeleinium TaxID=2995306 RepID=A0ABT5F3T0_9BACT|nr:AAA family ATPase [Polyangium mundeleinium]MDC0748651.1 AAA family ATPase [Polyangium mundeleinium]